MKRICYIATISKTIEWFMLEPAKYMADQGYEITIICKYDEEFEKKLPNSINYIPIQMNRGIDISGIAATYRLFKVFYKCKFDLIQYTTSNASLYSSLAGVFARVPVRLYRQWGPRFVGFTGIKRKIFEIVEHCICSFSTYVAPDSNGNMNMCRGMKMYSESNSSIVWNGSASGVDLFKFNIEEKVSWCKEIRTKHNISEETFVVGFVGRLNKDKGINELLEAFKMFIDKVNNSALFLVGFAENLDEIELSLLEWAKQTKAVIWVGNTSEVAKYYAAMDVFILPSYREGFGSVVIESEAMGVPVIVTDINGPTEAMINWVTGIIVPPKNTDELFNAIYYIYENKETRIIMGNNGRKFVEEKFDSANHYKKTKQLIELLLQRSLEA